MVSWLCKSVSQPAWDQVRAGIVACAAAAEEERREPRSAVEGCVSQRMPGSDDNLAGLCLHHPGTLNVDHPSAPDTRSSTSLHRWSPGCPWRG